MPSINSLDLSSTTYTCDKPVVFTKITTVKAGECVGMFINSSVPREKDRVVVVDIFRQVLEFESRINKGALKYNIIIETAGEQNKVVAIEKDDMFNGDFLIYDVLDYFRKLLL
jgi:hypothetical protein